MTVNLSLAKELADKVINQEKVYVLDVRDKKSVEEWRIEGRNVEFINIPLDQLKEGGDSLLKELPKDEYFYAVCAKGNTSQKAAKFLMEKGFTNVYSIEGGMEAWSEQLEPVKIGELKDGGSIFQFVRLGKGCLSYLIESNGEAIVVDASRMTETYEQFAQQRNLKIVHVLDTHLHADHVSGGRKLAQQTGATYYLPSEDAEEVVFEYEPIKDGKKLVIGSTTLEAVYSPGHTIGSTSFLVDDQYLLTGDILFIESIGRPDLAGKAKDWANDLYETLTMRYQKLAKDLIVLPGHYAQVSEFNDNGSIFEKLGILYKNNRGLEIENEEKFIKQVTEGLKEQPNAYEEIRKTNMGKLSPGKQELQEMETGPNNCAV